MSDKQQFIMMTAVGLLIGVSEALIYYNMGKGTGKEDYKWSVPPGKEFLKTVGIVMVTSAITAGITTLLEHAMTPKSAVTLVTAQG